MEKERNTDYFERFAGIVRLYGYENFCKITQARICLIGLGGVGSWACEALVRTGCMNLSIVDMDTVSITNTNRQIHAMDENYNCSKVDVLKKRILSINPYIQLSTQKEFVTEETLEAVLNKEKYSYDLVIDAIDGAINKTALLAYCKKNKISVISSGGCAGKKDLTKIRFADLAEAKNDKLLSTVRRNLRANYGFPKNSKKMGIPVVFADEEYRILSEDFFVPEMRSPAGGPPRPGTITFMTGTFGFSLAQLAINFLLEK